MRLALALIALSVAACADTVLLGTECVTSGACEQYRPPGGGEGVDGGGQEGDVVDAGEDQPSGNLDGGGDTPPEETPDSARPSGRDASFPQFRDAARPPPVPPDAGPAEFPAFSNPSFELVDGGREGGIIESREGSLTPTETQVAPWYICRGGTSVTSSATFGLLGRQTAVTPRDGNTFITDTFPIVVGNFSGITQELREPLVPGKRYAFAVDVFAQFDLVMLRETVLQFGYVDAPGCFLGSLAFPLAMSSPVTPGAWETKCIDFIAPQPESPLSRNGVRYVMLMATVPMDLVNFTALHFDHIRPHEMCGNVVPAETTP